MRQLKWEKEFDKVFKCIQPGCDNNGTYATADKNGDAEPNQCQFCFEKRFPVKQFIHKLIEEIRDEVVDISKIKVKIGENDLACRELEMTMDEIKKYNIETYGYNSGYNQKRQEIKDKFKELIIK